MADADEEIPVPVSQRPGDVDLSDETQDFRFLNSLATTNDAQSLPRRGEKDFEPNPTMHQASALASSRQAMHDALAAPRLHNLKTHLTAEIVPDKDGACVCVEKNRGQHFRTMGSGDKFNRIWLLPEEALYLIERGSLDIRWPLMENDGAKEELPLPMSLQAAYATLVGRSGLTLERYVVYAGLKRSGYAVTRAPSWEADYSSDVKTRISENSSLLFRIWASFFPSDSTSRGKLGPLVAPGLHRSYNDIYRSLALIPSHDPIAARAEQSITKPPFQITYNVWKPSTSYRKSAPPEPDFRIAVIDARTTSIPTLPELGCLLNSTPYAPPTGNAEKQLYTRLRHGYRNVILAVVDSGVVSFLRFSDTGFGNEQLRLQKDAKGGGKRGLGTKRGQSGRRRGK